jgi:hypothetical protein
MPQKLAPPALAFAGMLCYVGSALGSTTSAAILQNQLLRCLPAEYLPIFPKGDAGPQVAHADFGIGESLRVILCSSTHPTYW